MLYKALSYIPTGGSGFPLLVALVYSFRDSCLTWLNLLPELMRNGMHSSTSSYSSPSTSLICEICLLPTVPFTNDTMVDSRLPINIFRGTASLPAADLAHGRLSGCTPTRLADSFFFTNNTKEPNLLPRTFYRVLGTLGFPLK